MKLDFSPDSAAQIFAYLDRMPTFKKQGAAAAHFALDNITQLLGALGNPHHQLKCIHVAGTNGKGSTCAILAAALQSAGYRTGLYTSPHVTVYNERIKVNGVMIPDEAICRFFREHEGALRKFEHTYFELATALAFWWFAESETDIAVIEVGLGGRLDATNVIKPLVSVITSIGFDHTEILGNTLAAIAGEKAGIIKPETPCVIGNLPDEALHVVKKVAEKTRSPLFFSSVLRPEREGERIRLEGFKETFLCELPGAVQHWNAATAWQTLKVIENRFPVSQQQFANATENVVKITGLPARFEKLRDDRNWYFDGGHNAEAFAWTAQTIRSISKEGKPVLIFSMMKDKIKPEMLVPFFGMDEIWYYTMKSERAATFAEFASAAKNARHLDSLQTLRAVLNRDPQQAVFFLGSFYFYNTVKDWIRQL
jgi:dihydrofolate synthase/folylpolyglutamate synthase